MNYKYNIYWLLHRLPSNEVKAATEWLAKSCGVSLKTFERWMYYKEDNAAEIQFSNLLLMADFFRVPVEKMTNEKKYCNYEDFVQSLKQIDNVHFQNDPEK